MASPSGNVLVACLLLEQGGETYDQWIQRLKIETLNQPYRYEMGRLLRYHPALIKWEDFQNDEAKLFLDLRLLLPDLGYERQELDWKIRYYKEIFERRPSTIDDAAKTDNVEKLPDFPFGDDDDDIVEWHMAKLIAMRWGLKIMMPRLRDEIYRTEDYPLNDPNRPLPIFDDQMEQKRIQLLQEVEKMIMEKCEWCDIPYREAGKFSSADEAMQAFTNAFVRRLGNDEEELGDDIYHFSRHSPNPKKYYPGSDVEIYWICCECGEKNLLSESMRELMRHQYVRPTCSSRQCLFKANGPHRFCAFEFKWDKFVADEHIQHCTPVRQHDQTGDTKVYELQHELGMPGRSVNKWIKESWRYAIDRERPPLQPGFVTRWKKQILASDTHYENYYDRTYRLWKKNISARADFASDVGFLERNSDFKITDEAEFVL